jgi:hypothetical protein
VASHPASSTYYRPPPSDKSSTAFWMVATILLGFAVGVVGLFALMMWADAREARDSDAAAATPAATSGHEHTAPHDTALPLNSFAGVVPENAQALAEAHKATDATLPPIPAGQLRPRQPSIERASRRSSCQPAAAQSSTSRSPTRACTRSSATRSQTSTSARSDSSKSAIRRDR